MPVSLSVNVSADEITLAGDIAVISGVPTRTTVRAFFHYADGRVVDATMDSRVRIFEAGSRLAFGQRTNAGVTVTTSPSGGGLGAARVVAAASEFNLTANVTIDVVGVTGLTVSLVPYVD